MIRSIRALLVLAPLTLAACVEVPATAPMLLAPGAGKTPETFRQDAEECRATAEAATIPPGGTLNADAVKANAFNDCMVARGNVLRPGPTGYAYGYAYPYAPPYAAAGPYYPPYYYGFPYNDPLWYGAYGNAWLGYPFFWGGYWGGGWRDRDGHHHPPPPGPHLLGVPGGGGGPPGGGGFSGGGFSGGGFSGGPGGHHGPTPGSGPGGGLGR